MNLNINFKKGALLGYNPGSSLIEESIINKIERPTRPILQLTFVKPKRRVIIDYKALQNHYNR